MQSSNKKSSWIMDHLNIFWCEVSLSTRFCLQDVSVRVVCNLQIEIVIFIREAYNLILFSKSNNEHHS